MLNLYRQPLTLKVQLLTSSTTSPWSSSSSTTTHDHHCWMLSLFTAIKNLVTLIMWTTLPSPHWGEGWWTQVQVVWIRSDFNATTRWSSCHQVVFTFDRRKSLRTDPIMNEPRELNSEGPFTCLDFIDEHFQVHRLLIKHWTPIELKVIKLKVNKQNWWTFSLWSFRPQNPSIVIEIYQHDLQHGK